MRDITFIGMCSAFLVAAHIAKPSSVPSWSISFPAQCIEYTEDGVTRQYTVVPTYHAPEGLTLVEAKVFAASVFLIEGDDEVPGLLEFCAVQPGVPPPPYEPGERVVR